MAVRDDGLVENGDMGRAAALDTRFSRSNPTDPHFLRGASLQFLERVLLLLSWGAVLENSNAGGSILAGMARPTKPEAPPPSADAAAAGVAPSASSPGLLLLGNLEGLLSNVFLGSPFPCIYEASGGSARRTAA